MNEPHRDPSDHSRSLCPSTPLVRCTLRESGVHGIYSGITDSSYATLLAISGASPLYYALLSYGGSAVTTLSQHFGSRLALSVTDSRRTLSLFCFVQGILLLLLALFYSATKSPSPYLSALVCTVSLLSICMGNFSSPVWHISWARGLSNSQRHTIIANRGLVMTTATLLSVVFAALCMSRLNEQTALLSLLSLAGLGKLYSSLRLYHSPQFSLTQLPINPSSVRAAGKSISPIEAALAVHSFGFGMSTAFVFPYLTRYLGFSPAQIFYLGVFQVFGQLIASALLCRFQAKAHAHILLVWSFSLLALLPMVGCTTESFTAWELIFVLNGLGLATLGQATQLIIQTPTSPRLVADSLKRIMISTTLGQTIGGCVGLSALQTIPFTGKSLYIVLFILSAVVRAMALIIPKEYLGEQEGGAKVEAI